MFDSYFLLKLVHIVSSTVLFGTGLGTAAQMWLAHRNGSLPAIATVTRNVVLADGIFTGISGVVQPLTGLWLVWIGGYSFFELWLLLTYGLYVVVAACWFAVVWLQIRLRDLAAESAHTGAPLPAAYHRLMRRWVALGWPAFLGLLIVFYLMAAKPLLLE